MTGGARSDGTGPLIAVALLGVPGAAVLWGRHVPRPDEAGKRLQPGAGAWSEQAALDLATGRKAAIVARRAVAHAAQVRRATPGRPAWSADGRFLAALADVAWPARPEGRTVVLAGRSGRVIRLITSPRPRAKCGTATG